MRLPLAPTLLLLPGLLLAGCSGGADQAADPEPVALVTLAPVTRGATAQTLTLYGAADSDAGAKQVLAAPIEALVARIDAPVGTRVAAGQIVVSLTASPATRVDAAKAAADARAAAAAYARAQRLRKDGLVSDAEVETARAAAVAASAAQASFAERSAGLSMRARAPGTVEAIANAPGDLVAPGTAVATLSATGHVRARFGIDPGMAAAVRRGMPLLIRHGDGAFSVPVADISTVTDPQTRLAAIYASIPAAAGIGSGEPLSATLTIAGSGDGLRVPYAALLDDAGQPFVFVVANGAAQRRSVTVGAESGGAVEIAKGLKEGEQVVVAGGTAVEDGMKVRTH